jgi:hypothetical protein
VYETCERMELGGLTSEEVRIEVGSNSMHRCANAPSLCNLEATWRRCNSVGASGSVFPAVDKRLDGASH